MIATWWRRWRWRRSWAFQDAVAEELYHLRVHGPDALVEARRRLAEPGLGVRRRWVLQAVVKHLQSTAAAVTGVRPDGPPRP